VVKGLGYIQRQALTALKRFGRPATAGELAGTMFALPDVALKTICVRDSLHGLVCRGLVRCQVEGNGRLARQRFTLTRAGAREAE
jgi:hypothetical protein